MSLFDLIFPKARERREVMTYWKTLTAYQPTFRKWSGKLYESEIVRSAIDAKARHISKLEVKIDGAAKPKLQTIIKKRPNPFQTWSQFLYRAATILDMQNTLFIVPIIEHGEISGLWTCLPSRCRVLEDKRGKEWLEYTFSTNDRAAVELDRVGIMTKFQYESDLFGDTNYALDETMDLLSIERQGIKEAIKNAATFRFMARSTNWKSPGDLAEEQENFTKRNLSADRSGFLLFPNTYDSIQKIESKPYTISADDQALIKTNVYDYFGVNEKVIQNAAAGEELDAFFDGAIEPFAVQLSEVLTLMLFTDLEIAHGAKAHITANKLMYMSTGDKINLIQTLSDRGFITINEGRELLNYTPIEGGDVLPIRGEYVFVGQDPATAPALPAEGEENGN